MKLEHHDTQSTLDIGSAMIHQELSPVLDVTIAENIYLGREPTRGGRAARWPMNVFVDFMDM